MIHPLRRIKAANGSRFAWWVCYLNWLIGMGHLIAPGVVL